MFALNANLSYWCDADTLAAIEAGYGTTVGLDGVDGYSTDDQAPGGTTTRQEHDQACGKGCSKTVEDNDTVYDGNVGGATPPAGVGATTLKLRIGNTYSGDTMGATDSPSAQQAYPWLRSNAFLVEPHRTTTLSLIIVDASERHVQDDGAGRRLAAPAVSWTLTNSAGADVLAGEGTPTLTYKFTELDTFTATACLASSSSSCKSWALVSRYVRRELRELALEDRDLFLDTMKEMIDVPISRGAELFGADYKDMTYFVKLHLDRSSPQSGDEMHDGVGFLTAHAALSNSFESAMQVVNPSVALPWWDMTVDWAHTIRQYNGTFDERFWEGALWQEDFFGRADAANNTMTRGRFAYLAVSKVDEDAEAGMIRSKNAYGYLRAPWNLNKSPFVTRHNELCGQNLFYACAFSDPTGKCDEAFPGCSSHHDTVVKTDISEWTAFAWFVNHNPHAHVHNVLGGSSNCDAELDGLADVFEAADLTALKSRPWALRNVWRNNAEANVVSWPEYCAADAPVSDCHPSCDMSALKANETLLDAVWADVVGNGGTLGTYGSMVKLKVIEAVCAMPITIGEQAESASPSDPSFWAIHPGIERLYQ